MIIIVILSKFNTPDIQPGNFSVNSYFLFVPHRTFGISETSSFHQIDLFNQLIQFSIKYTESQVPPLMLLLNIRILHLQSSINLNEMLA